MPLDNSFKSALRAGRRQTGLWCSLGSNVVTEVLAGSGYDWLLVDAEHSPNDLLSVLLQAQAAAAYPTEIVVRLPNHDVSLTKRYLDLGIRSLLIPNVETVEQARRIVSGTRYPPSGIRGYSAAQRANRYGRVANYHADASQEIFVAVQVETRKASLVAKDLAAVGGVDAIFVGPGDLSADMGHLGNPGHESVQQTIRSILSLGQAGSSIITGTLTSNEDDAWRYIEWGAKMIALGSDLNLLVKAADGLARRFARGVDRHGGLAEPR